MKFYLFVLLFAAATAGISVSAGGTEENQSDDYPLDTCVVSGEKLGEMGKPFIYDYNGREVRFCCKMCRKDFLKDPEKYLAKIDEAAAARKASSEADAETTSEMTHDAQGHHEHGDDAQHEDQGADRQHDEHSDHHHHHAESD